MTGINKGQRACFYWCKKQNNGETFLYKNPDTLQKARQFLLQFINKKQDTLCYTIFHESFEFGIYIQEAWHLALCEVFIYEKLDSS